MISMMLKNIYFILAAIFFFFLIIWLTLFQNAVADLYYQIPAPIHRAAYRTNYSPAGASLGKSTAATGTVVVLTDGGFVPEIVTIKAGTKVTFKNKSSDSLWPASDPHPAHDAYPEEGGCAASTFDACEGIAPGGSWSFQFKVHGTWGYHNHLSPDEKGTIVVE